MQFHFPILSIYKLSFTCDDEQQAAVSVLNNNAIQILLLPAIRINVTDILSKKMIS